MFELRGKVAVVTGGAMGIGLQYVHELLKAGLKGVTVVDVNEEIGLNVLKDLQEKYGDEKILFVKADVSDVSQFEAAFKKTVETFFNVDILINNAGILDDRQWEKEIQVNLVGTINGTLLAIQNYISKYKSGAEGVIVNTSSVMGLYLSASHPVYTSTKHGITSFSRCMGTEVYYNLSKVRVLCVCPGATATDLGTTFSQKALLPNYFDLYTLKTLPTYQEPVFVAQGVIKLIKDGANGSVWVIDKKERCVQFPML